jgi:hypothetical protein
VIGLSHDWRAHMVYVGWAQHPVNQHHQFRGMVMCRPCIEDALRCLEVVKEECQMGNVPHACKGFGSQWRHN